MQPHQSPSNTAAKRASSSELNRWRDAGVDPELLNATYPEVVVSPVAERLSPHVAEWDASLLERDSLHLLGVVAVESANN